MNSWSGILNKMQLAEFSATTMDFSTHRLYSVLPGAPLTVRHRYPTPPPGVVLSAFLRVTQRLLGFLQQRELLSCESMKKKMVG